VAAWELTGIVVLVDVMREREEGGLFSDYIRQMACRAYLIVGSSVLPET
jgi:hypothetical protein